MKPNPGHQPKDTRGRRVLVVLANGRHGGGPWAADNARWSLTGEPFDIAKYEVVG